MKKEDVLANLGYFTEWGGGGSWENLLRYAIQNLGDLHGKTVLEVGPRFGKMSSCFALLGAHVVGIDTNAAYLKQAEEEGKRWDIQSSVSFFYYDGNLDHCNTLNQLEFDLIFTKSVLVLLGNPLSEFLQKLDKYLKPSGRCVFLENRHGGLVFSLLRRARPKSRRYFKRANYLRLSHLRLIDQVFPITHLKKSLIPPIYLIMTRKKISL